MQQEPLQQTPMKFYKHCAADDSAYVSIFNPNTENLCSALKYVLTNTSSASSC